MDRRRCALCGTEIGSKCPKGFPEGFSNQIKLSRPMSKILDENCAKKIRILVRESQQTSIEPEDVEIMTDAIELFQPKQNVSPVIQSRNNDTTKSMENEQSEDPVVEPSPKKRTNNIFSNQPSPKRIIF